MARVFPLSYLSLALAITIGAAAIVPARAILAQTPETFLDEEAVPAFSNTSFELEYSEKFAKAEAALRQGLVKDSGGRTQPTIVQEPRGATAQKPVEAQFASAIAPSREISNDMTKAAAPEKSTAQPKAIQTLQKKLIASEERVRALEQQLSDEKNKLIAAEMEISRLSTIIGNNNRARLSLPARVEQAAPRAEPKPAPEPNVPAAAPKDDLHVATISVDKAQLRYGPGPQHSPAMILGRGSRLAVEARQGEWIRVFAPNGERAWIHSKVVTFNSGSGTGSAVRVGGYDTRAELEAFKRVPSIAGK